MASRARIFSRASTDPGAASGAVVWHVPGAGGRILRDGATDALPGSSPAVGDGLVAWQRDGTIEVALVRTLAVQTRVAAPLAEELAVSATVLAWRETADGRQRIAITDPGGTQPPQVTFTAPTADSQIGRPVLAGKLLLFHLLTPRSARLVELDLQTGARRDLVAEPGTQLLQPSIMGEEIAYVRASYRRQQLVVVDRTSRHERILWSTVPTARRDAGREPGKRHHRQGYPRRRRPRMWRRPKRGYVATLWTTALQPDTAFVTRLVHQRGGAPTSAEIVAVSRNPPRRRRRARQRWVTR